MTAKTKHTLLLLGVILSTVVLMGLLGLLIYLEVQPADPNIPQSPATTAEPTPPALTSGASTFPPTRER